MEIFYELRHFTYSSCSVGLGNTGTLWIFLRFGLKTKTTLNWGKEGRRDLNVVRLRRTQLSHKIKTSIILSQVFCSWFR